MLLETCVLSALHGEYRYDIVTKVKDMSNHMLSRTAWNGASTKESQEQASLIRLGS